MEGEENLVIGEARRYQEREGPERKTSEERIVGWCQRHQRGDRSETLLPMFECFLYVDSIAQCWRG